MKNWKTTVAGVISGVLIILGMFLPGKFDPETQATLNSALNEIMIGVGAVVGVIANLIAKDPEK
ncbi:hypothetical protein KAU11_07515 [Candidatus Babeliales bacterium]|nr:hypothetical protein [Candidatus Babeliales bacterium]